MSARVPQAGKLAAALGYDRALFDPARQNLEQTGEPTAAGPARRGSASAFPCLSAFPEDSHGRKELMHMRLHPYIHQLMSSIGCRYGRATPAR